MSLDFRVISTGHAYPEGPCIRADGELFVVELAGGVVAHVAEAGRDVVVHTPGAPNGAAFDADGSLVFCNNGGNWGPNASTRGVAGGGGATPRIQRLHADGTVVDILTEIGGVPLNAPNDLAIDAHGDIWFTDPAWADRDENGRAAAADSPPGSLCWMSGDRSEARRLVDGLVFPNGLALTPDGNLVVGETGTGRIIHYDIVGRGVVGSPRTYIELGPDSFPDGMCFDSEGTLIVAGTGSGALFVVARDATSFDVICMDDPDVTNVCFGGPDGRSLFVTEASLGRVSVAAWHCAGLPLADGAAPWTQ